MFLRLIPLFFASLILLSLPASGMPASPAPGLEQTALLMKNRDFAEARKAAELMPEGGAKDFVTGMAAYKAGDWQQAALLLDKASKTFPVLADYALSATGEALYRLGRYDEALAPLERLLKNYPEGPLTRSAMLLRADLLQEKGDFPGATSAYQKFIERYPAGNDSLTALYKSAVTRDLTGDTESAVASFRQIWLNNPASPVAAKAETELKTIAARGFNIPPYKPEELYRRAVALYDLRKYQQAVAAFRMVPSENETDDFRARLAFKTGQALFRARQYREAEKKFIELVQSDVRKGILGEAALWLGKSQDKLGKEDLAVATYLKLADTAPASLAEEALLEAAYVRKWQKREDESLKILKRIVKMNPNAVKGPAGWEIAWLSYRTEDRQTALEYFRKLTGFESTREKALFWYGKLLASSGDKTGAESTYGTLLSDYPAGFYAMSYRNQAKIPLKLQEPVNPDLKKAIPLPPGYDRIKALLACGLRDEARKELSASTKNVSGNLKALADVARMYLEMDDYNAAFNLLNKEKPRAARDYVWGASYPLAFSDSIQKTATAAGIEQKLVYAVIRAESSFSPTAVSPVGAVGLMQLMPSTASVILGKSEADVKERLTLPAVNIRAGVKHLQDLISAYRGNMVAVVAAYNAGSGTVNRWLKSFGHLPQEEFIENIPYRETREYVKKVLAAADIYDALYGLSRPVSPVPASPAPVPPLPINDPPQLPAEPLPYQKS